MAPNREATTPEGLKEALRKTDVSLRRLMRSLGEGETDESDEELAKLLRRARALNRTNRELLQTHRSAAAARGGDGPIAARRSTAPGSTALSAGAAPPRTAGRGPESPPAPHEPPAPPLATPRAPDAPIENVGKRAIRRRTVVLVALAVPVCALIGFLIAGFPSGGSPAVHTDQSAGASKSAGHDEHKAGPVSAPSPAVPASTPKPKSEPKPITQLRGAEDFDPPPGDGQENPDEAPLAIDGDPTTAWNTEHYQAGFAGVGKDGVGLAVDAGRAVKASELKLTTDTPGWSGEVYAANLLPADLAGWGKPVGSIPKASTTGTIQIKPAEPARYYLVWITDLGNRHRAAINEIQLLG